MTASSEDILEPIRDRALDVPARWSLLAVVSPLLNHGLERDEYAFYEVDAPLLQIIEVNGRIE
jgi:hypothetical protein